MLPQLVDDVVGPLNHTVSLREQTNVFVTYQSFIDYLKQHPKCKCSVSDLLDGKFSVAARQAVTQVTVSKLVDTYGSFPTTTTKVKIATYLAELSQLNASDYFDQKTHKGFMAKDLENRRRKLPTEQRKWAWSKKKDEKQTMKQLEQNLSPRQDFFVASSILNNNLEDLPELEIDGCPRQHADCQICEGKYSFQFTLFVISKHNLLINYC